MALAPLGTLLLALGAAQAETENEVGETPLDLGRELFIETAQPPCGVCHALADADAAGTIGPNLDTLRPTAARTRAALFDGPGAMPSYADTLSEEEIEAVSQYVAAVARAE